MSEVNPVFRYTIEEHGDAHALYWGRNQQRHGYNLCRISDLSHNCDLAILEKTLNEGIEADSLRKRIAELEKENDRLDSVLEEVICTEHLDDNLRALVDKALNEGE